MQQYKFIADYEGRHGKRAVGDTILLDASAAQPLCLMNYIRPMPEGEDRQVKAAHSPARPPTKVRRKKGSGKGR